MPCAEEVYPPKREGWGELHGDERKAMVPFRQVWNTYNKCTGTNAIVPSGHPLTGTPTKIVDACPCRRELIIGVVNRTGTADVFLAFDAPAGMNKGIGPLTSHGSTFTMDGNLGIYPGTVWAVHNGAADLMLSIFEGWCDDNPVV